MENSLYHLNAEQVASGIRNRDFSAVEYISEILERIEKIDVKINAFVTVDNEGAIEKARSIDKRIQRGESIGGLGGVAIGVKDNICTKNLKTTCASRMLEEYVPPYDATVIKKLKENDAIIVGKLNLDEFAMGSTTEFSRFGPTRNPWNINCVAGGSSGGSAASVAALECAISLGSDTGGSVRCPSSFCSVVGLKPTYGCVSRYGLISYSNSLEQIGTIGRTVTDVMLIMNAIAGEDANDQTTRTTVPGTKTTSRGQTPKYSLQNKRNIRVGLVKELVEGADPVVSKCIYSAMDLFVGSDCKCEETSLKSVQYALASYYTIAMAEATSNLSRYDNIRYGFDSNPEEYEWNTYFTKVRSNFGEEVKRRIIIGSYVLSAGYYGKYYLKAQKAREMIKQEIKSLFEKYDVLISPTMPILPFKFGEKIDDPLKMYQIDIDTVVANLAGIPAISIPIGFNDGLPIGMQIMANEMGEQTLFDVASSFESTIDIHGSPKI
ncbi:MAG TPA: Asp-tRNA(Asn)/Glu-tRNA(Gln) amidotransferase subunit GatA [Candidatus Bathyarchaeia archaeon]|nr:Asp-tRNA(Asn)/Glu-tRNA(Gln) amidotransferase subunit GatA [Candidatus Bathyarchaeia archaeon]